jgi:hypothetical protein
VFHNTLLHCAMLYCTVHLIPSMKKCEEKKMVKLPRTAYFVLQFLLMNFTIRM